MSTMLHCGAEEVEYDALHQLPILGATSSHVPIPHIDVINMVEHALGYFDHEVVKEHHAVT